MAPLSPSEQLKSGITKLRLRIPGSKQEILLAYLEELQRWNKVHNLTTITDMSQMLTHHLLDSLSIVDYVCGDSLLDVGTGAGFPGIPLALALSQKKITLLDSKFKKIAFLRHIVSRFDLSNVSVVQQRVEKFVSPALFDIITCRAVGCVAEVVSKSKHLIAENGKWILMKGNYPTEELEKIHLPNTVHALNVPGLAATRHLVEIKIGKG